MAVPPENPFHAIIVRFFMDVESIKTSRPLVLALLNQAVKNAGREYNQYLDEFGEKIKTEATITTYRLVGKAAFRARKKDHTLKKATRSQDIISRGSLISLVSQYDSFLGNLLKVIYEAKPEVLQALTEPISYSQLVKFESISDAANFLIEKEVDRIIRKSHAEQIKSLGDTISVKIEPRDQLWKDFIEITERRNLFVHCDGEISAQYLEVCDRHKSNTGECLKGDKLAVSSAYFSKAVEVLLEMGMCLAHTAWRKLKIEEVEFADESLNQLCLDLLINGEYRLAANLLDYACCILKKWSGDNYRRIFIINRAQAHKWLGNSDRCVEILSKEDWTSCSPRFHICIETLNGNFDEAVALMLTLKDDPMLTSEAYRSWPIFNELRNYESFKQRFFELFGEALDVAELPSTPSSSPE